ncbi:MAG TPA: hypothetical protein VN944_13030, partial [Nitrospiria bacterium]|nr:hypothetical protein [Nitrospiria bacterium]
LNLFPPLLIAENIDIRNSPQEKIPLLTAGTIQISFSLWSLFTEVLVLHKVQIQDAEFRVIQRDNGKSNMEFLSRLGRQPPPGGKAAVALQRITLSNGSFDWIDPVGKRSFKARQIDLRVDADLRMETFQIKGQGKDIVLSLKENKPLNLSALEWKLAVTPEKLEIKSLTASLRENSLSAKGTIQFPSRRTTDQHLSEYLFQIETGFRIDLRPFKREVDYLAGHAQWTGSVSSNGRAEGTVEAPGIFLEKKKPVPIVENLKSHFIFSSGALVLDPLSAEIFDGKLQGSVTAAFRQSSQEFFTRFTLSDLSLVEPARLAFPRKESLADGKKLTLSGEVSLSGPSFALQQGRLHVRLTGKQPGALSSKDPFWENGLRLLTFFEGDIEADPGAISFKNVSANAGSSTLSGEGRLEKKGQIASSFRIRLENSGEITSLLGYPQWAGKIELDGEAGGTIDAPVFDAEGKVM